MQLEVRKVNLLVWGSVWPGGGAVVKVPVWLLEMVYW